MGMKFSADASRIVTIADMAVKLGGDAIQQAARLGLNEHTREQRRQSIVRVSAFTGVPQGYVSGKTTVRPAAGGAVMESAVVTKAQPMNIAKFGAASWTRAMPGAQATGWNKRQTFKGSFIRNGVVLIRTSGKRNPVRGIYGPSLANELVRRDWKSATPNPLMAERFAATDLSARILRILSVKLGF
jgi:hypothetical protein